jgi:hypothetical protein
MYAAIRLTVDLMAYSSPFKSTDPNVIELPFHEKIYLFRTIEDAWRRQHFTSEAVSPDSRVAMASSTPFSALKVTFSKKPGYRTFLRVLQKEFSELRFVVPNAASYAGSASRHHHQSQGKRGNA